MRRTTAVGAAVSLLLGGALLTCYAEQLNVSQDLGLQQGPKVQTFSGKIVSQNGVRLVLKDDDNNVWYHLDDQQKASQLFGKDVLVTGTFDGLTGTVRVQSIVEGKPPEKPPANIEEKKQNGDPARGATAPPASTGTAAPSARQVSPAQEPVGNVPAPRIDPRTPSESEASHHTQGEVSVSPVPEANLDFSSKFAGRSGECIVFRCDQFSPFDPDTSRLRAARTEQEFAGWSTAQTRRSFLPPRG